MRSRRSDTATDGAGGSTALPPAEIPPTAIVVSGDDDPTGAEAAVLASAPPATTGPAAAPAPDGAELDPRRWVMLVFILLGQLMVVSGAGSLNIAIPSIRDDLGATGSHIQWIVVLYQLGFAALLVTGGRMGDVYGRRRMFIAGLSLFIGASLLSAFAPSVQLVMAGRLCQGLGGGLASPQVLAMIQQAFPPDERRRAFAGFATVSAAGMMLGQITGGLILRLDVFGLGWRATFGFTALIGAVALGGAVFVVREPHRVRTQRGLDLTGVALLTSAAMLLLYPVVQGRSAGWPPLFFVVMAASVPAFAGFFAYERRVVDRGGEPLVDVRLFRIPTFRLGLFIVAAFSGTAFPVLFGVTLAIQSGLGSDELQTALLMAPAPGGVLLVTLNSKRLAKALGRRIFALGGLGNAAGILGIMAVFAWGPRPLNVWLLVVPILVFGVGQGSCMMSTVHLALSEVDVRDAGSASGVFQTAQQSMGAINSALSGVVFFGVLGTRTSDAGYVDAVVWSLALATAFSLVLFLLHYKVPERGTFTAGQRS